MGCPRGVASREAWCVSSATDSGTNRKAVGVATRDGR